MKILDLHSPHDFSKAGGKAAWLNRLALAGYDVPRGFVLVDIDLNDEQQLKEAAQHFEQSGITNAAVRSSASNEDGAAFSSAGQYSSFLNVAGQQQFLNAVRDCVLSLKSHTATHYSTYFSEAHSQSMSVVVQQMVDARLAGVCFTVSPAAKEQMLIEVVEGLGESLVSGLKQAQQLCAARDLVQGSSSFEVQALCEGEPLLEQEQARQIFACALRMEQQFEMPLDIEWAIDEQDKLFLLQARPITTIDECEIDELDPKYDMSGMTITRCNIGEMLPGAVTPLTISTNLLAIDYGMREMLRASGVIKSVNDVQEYSCALSVSNNLFINLSSLYVMDGKVAAASKEQMEMALCGRILGTPYSRIKKNIFVRIVNMCKYFKFLMSGKNARKELEQIVRTFHIEGDSIATLYAAIDQSLWINNRAMTLHYVTSSHSGAMSSALLQVMRKKYDEQQSKTILAQLLEGIDDIESVFILQDLRGLAQEVLKICPNAAKLSVEGLAELLKNAQGAVQKAHQDFMARHGHRTIREAEMRNNGWAQDEQAFLQYLSTVIESGAQHAPKSQAPNIGEVIKAHGFKGATAAGLKYLARQAREGVKSREFSKSKIIKVMDEFKRAYRRLAEMLCEKGALPEQDLIFFLTHREIGELVRGESFALIKKAIRRRRLLDEQFGLHFEEVSLGKPKAVSEQIDHNSGEVLKGTAISRGTVTGVARVVRSVEDARQLKKGEIMVAQYTDIGWSPYYCLISGIVTEVGSALSHGAVVAREYSLPLVSNVANATRIIRTGEVVTISDGAVRRH